MDALTSFRDTVNNAIAQFDARVAALDATETELYNVQPYISDNPDLMAEWTTSISRVNAVKATVESVRGQIASVVSWWQGVRDSLGIGAGSGALGRPLAAMGILPAIPWSIVALVTGGIATIGGVIYAASLVIEKSRRWQLQKENIAREQAGQPPLEDPYLGQDSAPGLFDGLGETVKWVVGGMLLLALLRAAK